MGEEPPVPEDGFGPRQTDPMTPDESENFQPPTSREPNPPVPVTPKGNPLDGENSVNGTFSAEVKQDELAPLGLDEKLTVTASSERIERMYLKASFHSPTVERKAIALKTPWAPQTQKIAGLNSK